MLATRIEWYAKTKEIVSFFFLFTGATHPHGSNTSRSSISCKMVPPQYGIYKLNIDGASAGNPGLAGCGSLLWDW